MDDTGAVTFDALKLATKTDLATAKTGIIKWIIGMAFALAELVLGVLRSHG